jgi:hypothetical protein
MQLWQHSKLDKELASDLIVMRLMLSFYHTTHGRDNWCCFDLHILLDATSNNSNRKVESSTSHDQVTANGNQIVRHCRFHARPEASQRREEISFRTSPHHSLPSCCNCGGRPHLLNRRLANRCPQAVPAVGGTKNDVWISRSFSCATRHCTDTGVRSWEHAPAEVHTDGCTVPT